MTSASAPSPEASLMVAVGSLHRSPSHRRSRKIPKLGRGVVSPLRGYDVDVVARSRKLLGLPQSCFGGSSSVDDLTKFAPSPYGEVHLSSFSYSA